jgi:methylenetetrahydrofolate reductase (NADPH)
MRIVELFGRDEPVFSFEFFPPRTDKGFDALFRTIAELKQLDPSFVSVTWGAGGSTRRKTVEIVIRIQRELGITAMCHLTCVGATRDEIAEILDQLAAAGIENVLPLRGDPPRDQPSFVPVEGGFRHANELVEFIRSRWDFCLPAACYPETHTEAPSPEVDLQRASCRSRARRTFRASRRCAARRFRPSSRQRSRTPGATVRRSTRSECVGPPISAASCWSAARPESTSTR